MHVSILIATFKRAEKLSATLESLCQLDTEGLDWEILLVDNACDGATKTIASIFTTKLPLVYFEERKRGKNNALNHAVPFAKGKLIVFTDDDIIAKKNWLKEIVAGASRWPDIKVFGGQIKPHWPGGRTLEEGVEKNILWFAYSLAQWDAFEGPYTADKVYGPNMMIRREIFDDNWRFNNDIGPSGSNYIMGSETEFTKRLEKEGMGAVYLPKAVIFHQISDDQLKSRWLFQRAFRCGRHETFYGSRPKTAMFFRVPRYLYRELIELFFKRVKAAVFFDRAGRINYGFKYWKVKGQIYQYRQNYFYDNTAPKSRQRR